MNDAIPSQLLGIDACRRAVWPDEDSAPRIKTFKKWISHRWFPAYKVSGRVYLDPAEVRAGLAARFRVEAAEVTAP